MPKQDESELKEEDFPNQRSRLRTILSRAALVYLGLFLGLSTCMSFLGIDPLIYKGALLKFLLIYVGAALGLALATGQVSLIDELTRACLTLGYRRPSKNVK
jgi:hypothetical protein